MRELYGRLASRYGRDLGTQGPDGDILGLSKVCVTGKLVRGAHKFVDSATLTSVLAGVHDGVDTLPCQFQEPMNDAQQAMALAKGTFYLTKLPLEVIE